MFKFIFNFILPSVSIWEVLARFWNDSPTWLLVAIGFPMVISLILFLRNPTEWLQRFVKARSMNIIGLVIIAIGVAVLYLKRCWGIWSDCFFNNL